MILVSLARMKAEITREKKLPSEFPAPLWPVGNYVAMAVIALVIVLIGIIPDSRPALVVGAIWIALLAAAYFGFVRGTGRVRKELVDETAAIPVIRVEQEESGSEHADDAVDEEGEPERTR